MLNKRNEISKLVEDNELLKAQIVLFRESTDALHSESEKLEKEKTDQAIRLTELHEIIDQLKTKLKESNTRTNELIRNLLS